MRAFTARGIMSPTTTSWLPLRLLQPHPTASAHNHCIAACLVVGCWTPPGVLAAKQHHAMHTTAQQDSIGSVPAANGRTNLQPVSRARGPMRRASWPKWRLTSFAACCNWLSLLAATFLCGRIGPTSGVGFDFLCRPTFLSKACVSGIVSNSVACLTAQHRARAQF